MSNYDRVIAREMAKAGNKVLVGRFIGSIPPYMEWIKWLSYESEYEKKRTKYFDSKKVSELSYEELEEASKYSRNKLYSKLFKLYGTSECSEEDYLKVYDYMCDESIEELMLSKLTSEELRYAKDEILRLSKISKKELSEKVNKEQQKENYKNLSMVDSYILHIISSINFSRSLNDLNNEINAQIEQNYAMEQKSLSNGAKTFI